MSKADRLEERKRKDRERKSAKRAENSSGRPRGRPRKMRPQQIETFAADAFSDQVAAMSPSVGATTPPAAAVGTSQKSSMIPVVDGAAGGGTPSRQFKTRIPTAMRLDKDLRQYAADSGFDRTTITDMFEIFKLWHLAKRAYSADWPTVWCTWVDREVDFVNERLDRQRRQAYYAGPPIELGHGNSP